MVLCLTFHAFVAPHPGWKDLVGWVGAWILCFSFSIIRDCLKERPVAFEDYGGKISFFDKTFGNSNTCLVIFFSAVGGFTEQDDAPITWNGIDEGRWVGFDVESCKGKWSSRRFV